MRILVSVLVSGIIATLLVSCGSSDDMTDPSEQTAAGTPQQADPPGERGGTITVGGHTWQLVPSIQCSVYPGEVVSIAGHAASDPDLEIVIDYNGPTGVRIGGEGPLGWYAMVDTLKINVDGKRVSGSATFNTDSAGVGRTAPGEFDVNCQ